VSQFVQFGANGELRLFGVSLVGLTVQNAKRLLFSVVFIAAAYLSLAN
jgi:hypothetical protein